MKILVVYHKQDALRKNSVFVPIHAGRKVAKIKSKDGIISDYELNWLCKHMIGDDTGDNISDYNRGLNEMTAIYWAWKNYDKIGSPNYIGLNHYRRFFNVSNKTLQKMMHPDCIITAQPCSEYPGTSHKSIFTDSCIPGHTEKGFNLLRQAVDEVYPNLSEQFRIWENENVLYPCNMFVMSKETFFQYCDWIFPLALKLHAMFTPKEISLRCPSFLIERMTSFWMEKISHKKLIPIPFERKPYPWFLFKIEQTNRRIRFYWGKHKLLSIKRPAKK